jgi:hypothetical protein
MGELMKFFDKSERTVRRWCKELGFKEKEDAEIEVLRVAKKKKHDNKKKRFLITSAQSATPINKRFLENLEAYAKYIDAEILVIPFRYKNPTSMFTKEQQDDEWWDPQIVKYLTLNRHDLNNSISVLSDIKIQPTASNPLSGLEGITGEHSSVIGHPRLELRSIPVMEGAKPKIIFTTGACTIQNFSDNKVGKTGEFHFSTGFAIIELKDKETFFFRQVSANKNGEFIDLFYSAKDGVVSTETDVEAVIMGDIHVSQCDERVVDRTFNDLFKKLQPKKVFIHDLIDSESISHHNLRDPFYLHEQELRGGNSLQNEIDQAINWLKQVEKYDTYIVHSNHDTHIDRFLRETDWRKMTTFKNAIPYMELSLAVLQGKAKNGVVPYIVNKHYPKIKCLGPNDRVIVKGYLLSMHGHIGVNGSRGSLMQFSKLSTKSVVGHSHSIGRIGGSSSVGCSCRLRLGYNNGPSNWSNAHGIVNRLGKFQHIVFFQTKDGMEYTTLK